VTLVTEGKSFMKNVITIIAVVLTLTLTSFAGIITEIPSSGGGGGSSSGLPTERQISGEIQQDLEFGKFDAHLYAYSSSAWEHTWTEDNGQSYSHIHAQESSGNFWFNLDQEFMGKNYAPENQSTRFNRRDDKGSISIQTTFTIKVVDEIQNWINPPQSSMNYDFFSINFYTNTALRHEEIWSSEDYTSTQTDNLQGNTSFSFIDSIVEYANFNVYQTSEWDNGVSYSCMQINAWFDILYTGSNLDALNSTIEPAPIPEPATLTIFALGSLLFRRKR